MYQSVGDILIPTTVVKARLRPHNLSHSSTTAWQNPYESTHQEYTYGVHVTTHTTILIYVRVNGKVTSTHWDCSSPVQWEAEEKPWIHFWWNDMHLQTWRNVVNNTDENEHLKAVVGGGSDSLSRGPCPQPGDRTSVPGHAWWKERTNSQNLSSDLTYKQGNSTIIKISTKMESAWPGFLLVLLKTIVTFD